MKGKVRMPSQVAVTGLAGRALQATLRETVVLTQPRAVGVASAFLSRPGAEALVEIASSTNAAPVRSRRWPRGFAAPMLWLRAEWASRSAPHGQRYASCMAPAARIAATLDRCVSDGPADGAI